VIDCSQQACFAVKLSNKKLLEFKGRCLAKVVALNHDDSIRRLFALYEFDMAFVAQRIDDPNTINVRYWGAECQHVEDIYDFFGNEPLANYLYGCLGISVPGLQILKPEAGTRVIPS